MKSNNHKDSSEKLMWDRTLSGSGSPTCPGSRLMVLLLLLVSATYVVYTLKLISNSRACHVDPFSAAAIRRLNDIVNSSRSLILFRSNQTEAVDFCLFTSSAGGDRAPTCGVRNRCVGEAMETEERIYQDLVLYCDNSTVVFFSKNDKYSKGAKYMELKYLFVKEEVQKRRVSFEHIKTNMMVADLLAKGLQPKAFVGHVERMGIIDKVLLF